MSEFKKEQPRHISIDEEIAHRIDTMAENGELDALEEKQLIELMGEPTWRYSDRIVWNLHPYIWDGRITLDLQTGEVSYSYDQGGSL